MSPSDVLGRGWQQTPRRAYYHLPGPLEVLAGALFTFGGVALHDYSQGVHEAVFVTCPEEAREWLRTRSILMSVYSPEVTDICREFWNPPRTRCDGCPIFTVCTEPVAGGQNALDAHRERFNQAAALVPLPKRTRSK